MNLDVDAIEQLLEVSKKFIIKKKCKLLYRMKKKIAINNVKNNKKEMEKEKMILVIRRVKMTLQVFHKKK